MTRASIGKAWGLALLALGMAACAPPAGALVTTCSNEVLSTGDPQNCTIRAERLEEEQAAALSLDPYWSRVELTADLTVASGAATVSVDQLPGQTWTLRPDAPVHLDLIVPYDRGLKGIRLRMSPLDGAVDRVSGTLRYKGRTVD